MLDRQSEESLLKGVQIAGAMVRKLEAAAFETINKDQTQLPLQHEGD